MVLNAVGGDNREEGAKVEAQARVGEGEEVVYENRPGETDRRKEARQQISMGGTRASTGQCGAEDRRPEGTYSALDPMSDLIMGKHEPPGPLCFAG